MNILVARSHSNDRLNGVTSPGHAESYAHRLNLSHTMNAKCTGYVIQWRTTSPSAVSQRSSALNEAHAIVGSGMGIDGGVPASTARWSCQAPNRMSATAAASAARTGA